MTTLVDIDVYLQAVGGKYLGPNAYETKSISVTLTYAGNKPQVIPYNPSGSQDDGEVNATFTDGLSSPFPILKQVGTGAPSVNYLTPGTNPIKASLTNFPLSVQYDQASLEIKVPTPYNPASPDKFGYLVINTFLILDRAQNIDQPRKKYRVTIPVHGLLLRGGPILEGPANLGLSVAMMCGCPITNDGTKFWPDFDFEVFAEVHYQTAPAETLPMNFTSESFYTLQTPPEKGPVKQAYFTARQKSTGNYGYGQLYDFK